ncbi:hypothetical protein [Nonomuraea wenchangensis]|uniref:Uncharacterized protein n=1 Tax=Nonomuraea wenchangensis TaxID=568860 RepID=A0A1I0K546_9ACTN|nr:hypothetical protein [Nonomuraea wenchangensis]SEU18959.1 hypothetical protein SAMN05421811_10766 [Nonomuraea wenchangensis]
MPGPQIDRSRLKVTSRAQIARLRDKRAHDREGREVRRLSRLYRQLWIWTLFTGFALILLVGVLRGIGVLPPLTP